MTTAIAKKPLRQVDNVRELFINDMAQGQLSAVAAKHMNPERMMRMMANAARTTPAIYDCDPLSLLGAMMTCASLGLEANTPLGHAYLIPFKNRRKNITEVQLIIGYKGMLSLMRRSGSVVNVHADIVFEGDDFDFEYGSNQHLMHRPLGKSDKPEFAYCHVKLVDGEGFVVWPYSKVLDRRNSSQGYKSAIQYNKKDTPWIAHEQAMARKTMVRAIFNYMPINVEEISDTLQIEDGGANFIDFALDPDSGITIDGEVVDEDTGEIQDDEPPKVADEEPAAKPKPKPRPKPKPKPKVDAKPEASEETNPDFDEVDEPQSGMLPMIMQDIADSTPESVDGVVNLYQASIDDFEANSPAVYDEIMNAIKVIRQGGEIAA